MDIGESVEHAKVGNAYLENEEFKRFIEYCEKWIRINMHELKPKPIDSLCMVGVEEKYNVLADSYSRLVERRSVFLVCETAFNLLAYIHRAYPTRDKTKYEEATGFSCCENLAILDKCYEVTVLIAHTLARAYLDIDKCLNAIQKKSDTVHPDLVRFKGSLIDLAEIMELIEKIVPPDAWFEDGEIHYCF